MMKQILLMNLLKKTKRTSNIYLVIIVTPVVHIKLNGNAPNIFQGNAKRK